MKISKRWKFLNKIYYDYSTLKSVAGNWIDFSDDNDGIRQFILEDSTGEVPTNPHPYYEIMKCGKAWFQYFQTETKKSLLDFNREFCRWQGMATYWSDYKGNREEMREFFSWMDLPEEMFSENDDEMDWEEFSVIGRIR